MDLCQERKNNILLKYFKRKFGKPKTAETGQNLKASRCYDCVAGQVPFRFGIALFVFRLKRRRRSDGASIFFDEIRPARTKLY